MRKLRAFFVPVFAVAAVAVALLAPAAVAGAPALDAPLTVAKVVDGVAPAGTTFAATIQCSEDIIEVGEGETDVATVTFDALGQPTSQDTFGFDGPGLCNVTETTTGEADSVAYACEGVQGTIDEEEEVPIEESFDVDGAAVVLPPVCGTSGPAGPITVNISAEDQSALVTITNTFDDPGPQAAPLVVAQPAFTG